MYMPKGLFKFDFYYGREIDSQEIKIPLDGAPRLINIDF